MKLRKRLLKKSQIYLIIDSQVYKEKNIPRLAQRIKELNIDIIQYRDKSSRRESIFKKAELLSDELSGSETLFIINDYADIALKVNCDGVHLGQDDTSIEEARAKLGEEKIIGVSCHSLKEALSAEKAGADYIAIGPIFPTPLKPEGGKGVGLELIKDLRKKIRIPFFAIGGINMSNIKKVRRAGAKRIVMCREGLNLLKD